ncbi:MAG TPA: DUF1629 domain-containing protein [Cellvibrio sp.]|nr:DUF1629 domain-containing protein [Cellvibrio sp.]
MIYKLGCDYENTALLSIDGVELLKKMPALRPKFFATPKQKEWVAPEASFYYSENYKGNIKVTPDVTVWTTGVLAFSPKAYDVFHELLANAGEFLPVSVDDETHYLFNTLYIIPDKAIDKSKAVEVIDTGVHFGQTNVAFDESFLGPENIFVFKSNTNKLLYSFCTDEFKNIYDSNNFKGIIFEPVDVK